MVTQSDKLLKGLEFFNVWTQVLIGTASAGAGWIVMNVPPGSLDDWRLASLACLCLSIGFGVMTMCQIPEMAQDVDDGKKSVYDLRGCNYLLPFWRVRPRVIWLCWPQHTFYICASFLYLCAMWCLNARRAQFACIS